MDQLQSLNSSNSNSPFFYEPGHLETLISYSLCLVISLAAIFANVIIIGVIRKNPNMHSTCFRLISLHSVVVCQMSAGFTTNALLALTDRRAMSRLTCSLIYLPSFASATPVSALLPCAIALDRLIGIARPFRYARISEHLWRWVAVVCFILETTNPLVELITIDHTEQTVICVSALSVWHPYFATYYLSLGLVFFVLSVFTYAWMKSLIKRHRSVGVNPTITSAGGGGILDSDPRQRAISQQMALVPLIERMLSAYICLGVLPHLAITVAPFVLGGQYQARIVLHATFFKSTLGLVDFFVLLCRCVEFRKTLLG